MTPDQKATRNAIEARQVETLGAGTASEPDSHDTQREQNTQPGDPTDAEHYHRTGQQVMGNASSGTPSEQHTDQYPTTEQAEQYAKAAELKDRQQVGNVPSLPALDPDPIDETSRASAIRASVYKRLVKDGRWKEVEPIRDQMMRESRKSIPSKEARQLWVYGELDRMYPPLKPAGETDLNRKLPEAEESAKPAVTRETDLNRNLDGQIQGLSEIPADWPDLPANASLAGEVGWVQANRLRVVEERPGRATVVRLDLALSPAPSWAALGWLETSIRSYAKFVDVAAKVSGSTDDEGAVMKRERRSVDEVRALLDEMMEAEGTCPSCGRPF